MNFFIGNENITPTNSVRNLGLIFDNDLSLDSHINSISKKVNIFLSLIRHTRPYLSKSNKDELVHSLLTSTLDYYNAILYNIPDYQIHKLQLLQNLASGLYVMSLDANT